MEASVSSDGLPSPLQMVMQAVLRGAVVITPGRRAANRLAQEVDTAAVLSGQQSWRAATILPWSAWIISQWDSALLHGADTRVVLTQTQERALWKSIVLEDGSDTQYSALQHVAVCMQTSRLLGEYVATESLSNMPLSGSDPDSTVLFQRWYTRFKEVCARENYLPSNQVETELAGLLRQCRIPVSGEVLLFGFPEFLPSRRQLLSATREAGSVVSELTFADAPQQARCVQYTSREAELQACASWVRARLQQALLQTVTVVVPDLQDVRNELERELRMAVSPESASVVDGTDVAYEFSSGLPLYSVPLVRDALLLLRWRAESLSLEEAGTLLRSSHMCLADSPESGALLEVTVLRVKPPMRKEFSLRQASLLLRSHPAAQGLMQLSRYAAQLHTSRGSYAQFAAQAEQLLQIGGWPSRTQLNTEEIQAVDAWQRAMDAVASLDLLGKRTTWPDFLGELQTAVRSARVVPQHRGLPVQVTTVEDALGCSADALWFLHAEANTWPTQPALNPLLPLALQREFGMPGADSKRDESAQAARLGQIIHGTAGEVHISWSGDQEQDSGRLSHVAEQVLCALGAEPVVTMDGSEAEHAEPMLETFFDTTALPPLPEAEVSGGVSILTAQAQCGFRAWAEKRLFAMPWDQVDDGLSPQERGDQVHAVLQAFWAATHSQAELRIKRLTVGEDGVSERDRLLRTCIADVCKSDTAENWDSAYFSVQKERLFKLLSAWLDYEEERPPFEIIQLEQESKHVPVGPLKLHMRVDRVDRVLAVHDEAQEEIGTLLIDYKTGSKSNSPKDWSGQRPEQPQLPAYATAAAISAELGALNGIAFASVRAGAKNMQLNGLAEPGLLPPRKKRSDASFSSQKDKWRQHLEALAQAFADGRAEVAPKSFPKTCDTCGQRLLCRLDAATLLEEDGDLFDQSEEE